MRGARVGPTVWWVKVDVAAKTTLSQRVKTKYLGKVVAKYHQVYFTFQSVLMCPMVCPQMIGWVG